MTEPAADNAAARQRLLVITALMLEALYEQSVVPVLATLKPSDMRPGGARVPGTSYELPAATAARVMQQLLALRNASAAALVAALAEADIAARFAALTGKPPPVLQSLYAHCTPEIAAAGSESLPTALRRLFLAAEKIFTLTHLRRIDEQFHKWSAQPTDIDQMPVQQFIARFVRNAPP